MSDNEGLEPPLGHVQTEVKHFFRDSFVGGDQLSVGCLGGALAKADVFRHVGKHLLPQLPDQRLCEELFHELPVVVLEDSVV